MKQPPTCLTVPIIDVDLETVIKPGYLTVAQAAQRTGMTAPAIRNLAKTDRLQAVRPRPRLVLILESSLEAYEREMQTLSESGHKRGRPRKRRAKL